MGHTALHIKGGAIYNKGILNVVNSTLRGASAHAGGGAIFNDGGTVNITNGTLHQNFGGAVLNEGGGTVNVTDSAISASTKALNATGGGGITNVSGTVNLKNVTISGNESASGIDNRSGGAVNINNSTITGNGIAAQFTPVVATGGGIANVGTVSMSNTIVAGNTATTHSDISGPVNSQGSNLVGNTAGSSGLTGADLQNVSAQLGPLQFNGGPTKTHALLSASPAIDSGNASTPSTCEATDQRGAARPVDGPDADTNAVCDIGAYEFGAAGPFSSENASVPGIGVLFNDSDADRDLLMAVLVSDAIHGTLTLHDPGGVTYVHSGDENTADSFTYKATDGAVESGGVTVNITVTPVNDGPIASGDSAAVARGGIVTALDSGETSLLANDVDHDGPNLKALGPSSNPKHGFAVISGDGTFAYTHSGDQSTGDDFLYTICDQGSPSLCTTATVTIKVIEGCTFPTNIVKAAWNLIAWACDNPGNPGDIAASLGVSSTNGLVRILEWDATWQSFTKSYRSDRPFNTLTALTKWNGYWLFHEP